MRGDRQILHHITRIAFEPRALRRCLELDGSLLVNRQLRCLACLLARLVPGLRLGRLLHATGFDIRPSRPTLEPSDLVALGINRSPQLGHFSKQLQHQIFEFGVRKAVKVKVGRRHSQNESDSRPLVNRKIIPPRLLPLLRISSCQSSQKTQSGTLWEDHSRPRKSWGSQKRGTSPSERLRDRHGN